MTSVLTLGLLTLTSSSLSFFLKLPQIASIIKSSSVEGINRISLLIELWNFMTSVSYSAYFDYPRSLYLEYSGLILQSLIIFGLVIKYSSNGKKSPSEKQASSSFPNNSLMILLLISMTILHSLIAFQFFEHWIPTAVILTSLPSGSLSRIIQIRQIIKTRNPGSLSALTWFLAAIATGCRFTTNILTVADSLLLFRLGSATLLNISLSVSIICYRAKIVINKND